MKCLENWLTLTGTRHRFSRKQYGVNVFPSLLLVISFFSASPPAPELFHLVFINAVYWSRFFPLTNGVSSCVRVKFTLRFKRHVAATTLYWGFVASVKMLSVKWNLRLECIYSDMKGTYLTRWTSSHPGPPQVRYL